MKWFSARDSVSIVTTAGVLLCLLPSGGCEQAGGDASLNAELNGEPVQNAPPTPWPALTLAPPPSPEDNPPSEAKRKLGRLLFYDPLLSSDHATACVTCHSELWGLGDQLPVAVGVDGAGPIGPGRTGPNLTRRNSQALWNVAYRESLFWDGRAGSLEEQALMPMQDPGELNIDPQEAVKDLAAIEAYVDLFEQAFPEDKPAVTVTNMARALATFQRAYVSDDSPYDQYLRGDAAALTEADIRGMFLFDEVGCADCHTAPRFESERYAARHVPKLDPKTEDSGRFEFTEKREDRGAYRVPSLRNLRETGPYFHTGAVHTLDEAVAHEVEQQRLSGDGRKLTPGEFEDLLGFLRRGLVDVSREQHEPQEVPSGLAIPPDGDRLRRF